MTSSSPSRVKRMVEFFNALSDPTRQQILLLLEQREHCVSDLVEQFNLSQPTISKHLSILKNAGLVRDRREKQKVFYSLNCDCLRERCTDTFSGFSCCSDIFTPFDKAESSRKSRRKEARRGEEVDVAPSGAL